MHSPSRSWNPKSANCPSAGTHGIATRAWHPHLGRNGFCRLPRRFRYSRRIHRSRRDKPWPPRYGAGDFSPQPVLPRAVHQFPRPAVRRNCRIRRDFQSANGARHRRGALRLVEAQRQDFDSTEMRAKRSWTWQFLPLANCNRAKPAPRRHAAQLISTLKACPDEFARYWICNFVIFIAIRRRIGRAPIFYPGQKRRSQALRTCYWAAPKASSALEASLWADRLQLCRAAFSAKMGLLPPNFTLPGILCSISTNPSITCQALQSHSAACARRFRLGRAKFFADITR